MRWFQRRNRDDTSGCWRSLNKRNGSLTLDALAVSIPSPTWAQLFLAVDTLSRSGAITLRSIGRGEYLVSLGKQTTPLAVSPMDI